MKKIVIGIDISKEKKQNTTKNQNKTPQKTKTTGRKNAYTIPNGVKIFPFISFKD